MLQPGTGETLGSLNELISAAGASIQPTAIAGLYEVEGPAASIGSLASKLSASSRIDFTL